jgi:hypothetical protein
MDPTVDIALRLLAIAAQVSIPIVIFFAGRQIARAQYVKSTQDAWNEFNKLAIANADNVRVSQQDFGLSWTKNDPDAIRKAYMAFVGLNAMMTVLYGVKHKLLPADYRTQSLEQILSAWVADDQIYEMTQSRGYPLEFQKICKRVRNQLRSAAASGA